MKTLVVNRNLIVSIFVVMLLIYGIQGISYGQELLIEPSSETKWLYWAEKSDDSYTIRRIDLANGQSQDVISGFGAAPPSDIAIDASEGKIYWSVKSHWWARSADRIQRANLDGTDIETVVGNLEGPNGIDLDLGVQRNKIYWADGANSLFSSGKIQRADLEGTNVQTIIRRLGVPLHDVAVDASGGKIYWTRGDDWIQRANLDGSNVQTIITGVEEPNEIAVDASGGKIYWTDNEENRIQRANLDGTDIEDVATGFSWWEVIDFAIDPSEGKIYWGSSSRDKIQRADLDGANVQNVVVGLGSDITAIALATIPNKTTSASSFVEFSDVNLARAVRSVLALTLSSKVDLLKIPNTELEKLTTLDASDRNIIDLTGLEHASQLTELTLQENDISDITPLAQLTQLVKLNLHENQISDITPLAQLTQLVELYLWDNDISDITPLAQLTQLVKLNLHENQISDITPLAQLTQLVGLGLYDNNISDVTPLAQLTQLVELYLSDNDISDITPLAQLTQLVELYLWGNDISDITPLAQLTQLVKLNLSHNQISDVTPLAGLISLEWLRLAKNPIETTYPLNALLDANPDIDLDVILPKVLVVDPDSPPIYWTDWETAKIQRANLDGSYGEDLVTSGLDSPYGIALDIAGGKMYWTDFGTDKIQRANLDGSNVQNLVTSGLASPFGITLDIAGGKMYWMDAGTNKIQRANLDGSNVEDLITSGLSHPRGIALDITGGKMYWTDFGTDKIQRANLDGSNVEDLITSGLSHPRGIALDITGGKMYWTDFGTYKIQRANLDGSNVEDLVTGLHTPGGIALDVLGGKMYWAQNGKIQRANLNGSNVEDLITGLDLPYGIALGVLSATVSATVSVAPSPVPSPAIGEQLTLSLNIADGENVAGYQATVQFDTTALRYVSSANGDYLPAGAFFVPPVVAGNQVRLAASAIGGESNGDGTLATLTFEVIEVKASSLTLSDVVLSDSAGTGFRPQVENGEIVERPQLTGDINDDGVVNIQDLVIVAGQFGQSGQNSADVNKDGVVNIQDLVLVAGAFGNTAAAPALRSQALAMLTANDVQGWLAQARGLALTDAASQRGIIFLEQLLSVLIPKETALLHNYPNPFNPETWIPYDLAKDAEVTLHIYAVNGTLVRTLALGHQAAGIYQNRSRAAYWDGRNAFGEKVASGLYFYTLTAGDFSATRKMLIRK